MQALFASVPEAITNTSQIAARCHVAFQLDGTLHLPKFRMDGVEDCQKLFLQLCRSGLRQRYGNPPPQEAVARMKKEIAVIQEMGYVDYFLIVWDYITYARKQGIPVGPGRGSGAGSICAYCMGITQIDPLPYHLLFERFLNPERGSMPDFDIGARRFLLKRQDTFSEYIAV